MAKSGTLRLQDVLEDYWVGEKLGVGARSFIYEIKRKRDGELFACKFVSVRREEDLRVIGHLENGRPFEGVDLNCVFNPPKDGKNK